MSFSKDNSKKTENSIVIDPILLPKPNIIPNITQNTTQPQPQTQQPPQPIQQKLLSSTHKNIIGYYELDKNVGEGNFAKVKLGKHIITGEKVKLFNKRLLLK